jgi:hypothetical protein
VRLTAEDFTIGQTILKVASSRAVKHKRVCSDNQYTFIPVDILKRSLKSRTYQYDISYVSKCSV